MVVYKKRIDKYSTAVSGTNWSLLGRDLVKDEREVEEIVRKIMLLNAFKLTIKGIPMFYQGEELGLSNDFSYLKDKNYKGDSRCIKRIKITDSIRSKTNKKARSSIRYSIN